MNEAILIFNALWVLFLSVLAFCVMLTRQVGILHDQAALMDTLTLEDGPKVGEKVPALLLPSMTGIPIQLGAPYGQASEMATLLIFVSPACPICKELLPIVKRVAKRERDWLRVVLASEGERLPHSEFIRQAGLQAFPYILSYELGIAYRVPKLPYAVVIGENGTLQAKRPVTSRKQFESLFIARDLHVSSIRW